MPLIGNDDMEIRQISGSNFTFSGARIDDLGAPEYTLAVTVIDETGSVSPFAKELKEMLKASIASDKKAPRSENLLERVTKFSTSVGNVREIHGFKPLSEIDVNDYPDFNPGGATPLYDAAYEAVGSVIEYGAQLTAADFLCNAIVYLITDGEETGHSTATTRMIRERIESAVKSEKLESLKVVVIGINTNSCRAELDSFCSEIGAEFIDAGDATPSKLAQIAGHRSQSVSSTSQALGTGGPSQNISVSI